jgi:polyisoprenyl-teichoic acid--peptidoglycan teichoic acid transferase
VLDGIDIDIPEELAVGDWWYSDDDYNARWISFPPGMQHLDGYHAVAFGRNRDSEHGDLDRMLRQQLVLQTAVKKIFSQKLLDDPVGLWNAYGNIVKTDIPTSRILALGLLAKETSGNMATYSLGQEVDGVPTVSDFVTDEGADVLLLNPENVSRILGMMFAKATYVNSHVEIQDGIGGLEGEDKAAALGRYLRFTKQLPTVYESGVVDPQAATTITVYDARWNHLAQEMALWLGIPAGAIFSAEKLPGSAMPDIIVTIGDDFRMPG